MQRPNALRHPGRAVVILGTAGHVDHGKTSLVRALTGVDLDVLEQERQRGMTIQLGFTEWRPPGGHGISIVDVPGHARFAHTMAKGALGLDAVMLVVAADEGVMPQTREHLNACRALGLDAGVVALTRIDRVADVDASRAAVAEALRGSVLEAAPIVPVCAPRGQGLEALAAAVQALPVRPRGDEREPAMLPIDRAFSVRGVGAVVTGTLLRGTLRVDDVVELLPARRAARVRGLQIHGEPSPSACAGQRIALNLASADAEAIAQSSFAAAPSGMCVGRAFDAELRWLPHVPHALTSMRSLGFVCGAVRASARITADAPIAPGGVGVARVVLDREVPLSGGLRFLLRGAGDARASAPWSAADACSTPIRRGAARLRSAPPCAGRPRRSWPR